MAKLSNKCREVSSDIFLLEAALKRSFEGHYDERYFEKLLIKLNQPKDPTHATRIAFFFGR
jgi:hypothetical protein